MKALVISDIHANLTALDSVIEDAEIFDMVWCLGDLVGYGPDPNECIERVRELPNLTCIIGNHDSAVLDQIDPYVFNSEARRAIEWTKNTLSPTSLAFLESLPESMNTRQMLPGISNHVTLVHGSPRQPIWEYLLDTDTATRNFEFFDTAYCFVGHTHLPLLFYYRDNNSSARPLLPETGSQIALSPRAIINPGSVGQPRDRDSRAAYILYDLDREVIQYRRVAYDIKDVQKRMRNTGLPERHIVRLEGGW
jgi:predicted phosphodiesterase